MANEEHLRILMSGVEEWNEFAAELRIRNLYASLEGANLNGANLSGANLNGANLNGANLTGANLTGADLGGARLVKAYLKEAALQKAFLQYANFYRAELVGAKLVASDLSQAKLGEANLERANLTSARLWNATLEGANLEGANFEGANLEGASLATANLQLANLTSANLTSASLWKATLDGANLEQTNLKQASLEEASLEAANATSVIREGGRNPFVATTVTDLRRAFNLTQTQLNQMFGDNLTLIPAHLERPKDWPVLPQNDHDTPLNQSDPSRADDGAGATPDTPFVMLSYSSEDREFIAPLRAYLISQNITVWWDQNIPPGAVWRDEIAAHLKKATAVLTIWTQNSVASDAVIEEAAAAQKARKLVHARLDDAELPYGFAETQYANLRGWDAETEGMERLLHALRRLLRGARPEQATSELSRQSPAAFTSANGKLQARTKPLNASPPRDDPADLDRRVEAQRKKVRHLQEVAAEIEKSGINALDASQLIRILDRYENALARDNLNWIELADDAGRIARFRNNTFVMESLPERYGVDGELDSLLNRHEQMRLLIEPEQPPADEVDDAPSPQPNVGGMAFSQARAETEHLRELLDSDEAHAVADDSALDLIDATAEDMIEATSEIERLDETPSKERDKAISLFRRTFLKLAEYTAAFSVALSSAVAAGYLTNPLAATALQTRLQPILDFILKFFS